jgi:hypothetical protein
MILRPQAQFDLARRLRSDGAPLGEVFAFLSGLYFRGKLAYAHAFARAEDSLVITPNRGLVPVDTVITTSDLEEFGEVDIADDDPRYTVPLVCDLKKLDAGVAILLGSIATAKYVEPIQDVLGEQLLVPAEFAGRGDMSRGGLLLRHARAQKELTYESVATARRHGARPAKLKRLNRAQIATAAGAACERIFSSGAKAVSYVDWMGRELVQLGDRLDIKALIAGNKPRGVVGASVGRNGYILARGAKQHLLDDEAARLNALLEGVG